VQEVSLVAAKVLKRLYGKWPSSIQVVDTPREKPKGLLISLLFVKIAFGDFGNPGHISRARGIAKRDDAPSTLRRKSLGGFQGWFCASNCP